MDMILLMHVNLTDGTSDVDSAVVAAYMALLIVADAIVKAVAVAVDDGVILLTNSVVIL